MGELDEDCQKVQTFSYKINKYQDYKVQHYCMLYMKVVKRVNPIYLMSYLCEMMVFTFIVIIISCCAFMLHILNLHSVMCQSYPSKASGREDSSQNLSSHSILYQLASSYRKTLHLF